MIDPRTPGADRGHYFAVRRVRFCRFKASSTSSMVSPQYFAAISLAKRSLRFHLSHCLRQICRTRFTVTTAEYIDARMLGLTVF